MLALSCMTHSELHLEINRWQYFYNNVYWILNDQQTTTPYGRNNPCCTKSTTKRSNKFVVLDICGINCNHLELYCGTKTWFGQIKNRLGQKDKIEDILLIRFIKTTSKHEVEHEEGPCVLGKKKRWKKIRDL